MEVRLISYTPQPEVVVASAARLCYSPCSAIKIMDDFEQKDVNKFLEKLLKMGHLSPFEHASFTFAIDGVSRVLSHQLVRHRVGASFSQKSQRYVNEKQFEYVIPHSISKDEKLKEEFAELMVLLQNKYEYLLAKGIPAEDARYLLPNATTTNFVLTMNARSLMHFFELRCCNRAQKEIRELADLMLLRVREVAPALFTVAGPTCLTQGICFEGPMSCGKAVHIRSRHQKEE